MLKTYTLYLHGSEAVSGLFEPVMCDSTTELLEKAREVLARHPGCDAVEVYFGDSLLFQVKQDRKA